LRVTTTSRAITLLGRKAATLAGGTGLFRSTEQWGQHLLEPGDEVVGLTSAFGKVFYLIILHGDFGAKKSDFAVLLF